MAQNIVIAGATFNAVPSIVVPTSGNGTAVFVDPSPTTATDSDVASGKVYFKADGTQSTGTASGGSATLITKSITANGTYNASSDNADGYSSVTVNVSGGASNCVAGTFTGTAAGAMDLTLPYTGNGYLLSLSIYAKNISGDFASTVARYAVASASSVKYNSGTAPTYRGVNGGGPDWAAFLALFKSNSSGSTTWGRTYNASAPQFYDADAQNNTTYIVTIRSINKISVYITAGGEYGFQKDIEYSYIAVYSS